MSALRSTRRLVSLFLTKTSNTERDAKPSATLDHSEDVVRSDCEKEDGEDDGCRYRGDVVPEGVAIVCFESGHFGSGKALQLDE